MMKKELEAQIKDLRHKFENERTQRESSTKSLEKRIL